MQDLILICVIALAIMLMTSGNIINMIQNNKDFNIYKLHILECNQLGKRVTFPILKIKTACGVRFNFLLDTGADVNILDLKLLSHIKYDESKTKEFITSIAQNDGYSPTVMIDFSLGDNLFREEFATSDMTLVVDKFQELHEIKVHGIIGSKFFVKHKCAINFKDYTFWIR